MLSLNTKKELWQDLVSRCRAVRLRQNVTQAELAARAGIPLATFRRFEQEGHLSLERFVAILQALNQVEAIEKLLQPPPVHDLRELDNPGKTRVRARRSP